MVTIKRYDFATKALSEVEFDESLFGDRARVRCLRNAALMYAANHRQGTADTKERSEIAGTTKKPWKQKHTGRARAGSKKSPIWRGGGTIFGPHPRDFGFSPPRRELRVALRGALYGKFVDQEVALVANLAMTKPSSKTAREMFKALSKHGVSTNLGKRIVGNDTSCVVVLPEGNEMIWHSMRNFPKVSVRTAADLNAYDVLRNRVVLLTEEAAAKLKSGLRGIVVSKKAAVAKKEPAAKKAPASKKAAAVAK